MSSDLEALWREFEAETDDHLEALEQLLTVSRSGTWSSEDIGALFRAFHSLKGSFALMGMPHVEAVAHRSEDILALVREGHAPLDDDLIKLLLRAVDRLKEMRDVVITKRADAPASRKLIAQLEGYRNKVSASQHAPLPRAVARPASLGADPEMLGIFSELLAERLPELAQVLSSDDHRQAAGAQAAADLANGAEVLGFEALAEQLKNIATAAVGTADRSGLISRFNDLHGQVCLIEDATGAPSGAQSLAAALADELLPDYRQALSVLSEVLSADFDNHAAVRSAVAAARALANCSNFTEAVGLLVLVDEQHSRMSAGELTDSSQLQDIAGAIGLALENAAAQNHDVESAVSASLLHRWQSVLGLGSAPPPERPDSADHGFALTPEFRATLSAEQITRVEQSVTRGKRAFEILIDLESDPEISANILSWLTSAVETVTSRTVFREGKSYFEFLVLSAERIDWLRAQLMDLDPERLCIEDAREAGREESTALSSKTAAPAAKTAPAYVRVRSDVIDKLMAEVGEMRSVLAALSDGLQNGDGIKAISSLRLVIDQLGSKSGPELRAKVDTVDQDFRTLRSFEEKLEAAHRRIWEAGLQLRVVPLDALFTRLTRAARDLADRLNKPVDVMVQGADVRIDKSTVDLLVDPLMHMVRNALDHGIEAAEQRLAAGKPARAQLNLSALERSNKVQVTIADDGKGLDKARLLAKAIELGLVIPEDADRMSDGEICRLILHPGFSTAETVTELSGRGVGMDVVAAALQKLGGSIDVQTTAGLGTLFVLTIPLSASLVRSLLVLVEGHIFAIPDRQIVAVAEIKCDEIEIVGDRRFYAFRATMIPLHALGRLLGIAETQREGTHAQLVVVSTGTEFIGLEVDQILRFQDLFLKNLHPLLATVPAIGGASVLGDGRPVLVLDAPGLARFPSAQDEAPARTSALST
jgi:two-component system chemotaxis sensor kinase CheA